MNKAKVILIPGNGGATPQDGWFPYLERELPKLGVAVINKQFPDPILARQEFWVPFIKELGADENTILIGHSSGAIAALRFAEKNKIFATLLIGAYYTDLGEESEKKSGYFIDPWEWESIKNNQKFIFSRNSSDFLKSLFSRVCSRSFASFCISSGISSSFKSANPSPKTFSKSKTVAFLSAVERFSSLSTSQSTVSARGVSKSSSRYSLNFNLYSALILPISFPKAA